MVVVFVGALEKGSFGKDGLLLVLEGENVYGADVSARAGMAERVVVVERLRASVPLHAVSDLQSLKP